MRDRGLLYCTVGPSQNRIQQEKLAENLKSNKTKIKILASNELA